MIADETSYTVSRTKSTLFQGVGTLANSFAQLPPRDKLSICFCSGNDCDCIIARAVCWEQKIFGKIEATSFEEMWSWEQGNIRSQYLEERPSVANRRQYRGLLTLE
jgi:hypothetical protein